MTLYRMTMASLTLYRMTMARLALDGLTLESLLLWRITADGSGSRQDLVEWIYTVSFILPCHGWFSINLNCGIEYIVEAEIDGTGQSYTEENKEIVLKVNISARLYVIFLPWLVCTGLLDFLLIRSLTFWLINKALWWPLFSCRSGSWCTKSYNVPMLLYEGGVPG